MFATLQQYSYYKSFILDENGNTSRKFYPSSIATNSSKLQYFMNKSLNNNVKSYICEMSANFNGVKSISNDLIEKLQYKFNAELEIENNIKEFVTTYNSFISFLEKNAQNNLRFKNISNNIKSFCDNNKMLLSNIGININDNGFFEIKENINLQNIMQNKDKFKEFYSGVYKSLCNFMIEPMAKHMEFRDFSFYFTYATGFNKNNSFKLIQQGVIIDIGL